MPLQDPQSQPLDPLGPEAGAFLAKLQRYLRRCLGNPEDAREVAQEAYLRYLRVPDVKSLRQPHLYFYRIALNVASEISHRRQQSAVVFSSGLSDKHAQAFGDPRGDVGDQIAQHDYLQKVFDQIPWRYRQVLWMNKVEEMHYRDIARELGLAPSTVLEYLARAAACVRKVQAELRQDR